VYENRALKIVFGPEREKVGEVREDYIMRNFISSALHRILLG
jgi:hypothetical protein